MDSLPPYALRDVFEHYSGISIDTAEQEKLFETISEQVDSHTYAVELLARHAAFSGLTLREVELELKNGMMAISRDEKVLSAKDDSVVRQSIPDIIRVLFRLSSLSPKQKQVLRNLYLLNFMVMTKRIYKHSLNAKPAEMTALNDLIEMGFARLSGKDNQELYLHPLILEAIKVELKPTLKKCKGVYDFIKWEYSLFQWPDDEDDIYVRSSGFGDDMAEKYEYESHVSFLLKFFSSIDMTEEAALDLFYDWTWNSFKRFNAGNPEDDFEEASLWHVPEMSDPFDTEYKIISDMMRKKKKKTISLFFSQLAILHSWLRIGGYTYIRYDVEEHNKTREIGTRQAFNDYSLSASALVHTDETVFR